MKQILIILSILTFTSCDFKSSADYKAEAEKLESEGRYEEAIPLLDKAIEKDPENIYALINRGVDKSILEDYEGAIEDYNRIIQIDSDNALAYLNRGKNKKRLEDYQGAIDDFEKAIKTKGGESFYMDKVENSFIETGFEFDVAMEEIRFERGIARYNIDSLRLAFDDFIFCIDKNFEKPASLYWRGIIYVAYGMNQKGCSDLKEANKLGDPDAQEMINEYCK
ncbi:tetratricopeptide repeat protein [Echinicola sp. 20G]|uniref:tetratricopeptide repeat protein n=1 Tax=Echinicola sp. 20G TaxID=2781961 RepID=UPI001910A761|nr:tetratricopeptide repeat protein [Echinicola sp. 20G]